MKMLRSLQKRFLLVGLGVGVFLGCVGDPAPVDLSGPKAKWKRAEPDRYTYTIRYECMCFPSTVYVVATRDSVVTANSPDQQNQIDLGNPQGYSIDSLFAQVETALGRRFATRRYTFDQTYGFPDSVYIDFDKKLADEEYSLVIKDFQPAPTGL